VPTLETTDGKPVDVTPVDSEKINSDFGRAMNDDGPDTQAPPVRRRRAPAAEDEPAPKRRGRPPKEEKARTADTAVKDDYTEDAQNFVGAVWTVTASIPATQAYALVVENSSDGLAKSLAEGAKHNATIRAFVSSGESSWMLGLASIGLGMGMQAYQLMKDPALREAAAATTREHLKDAIGAKKIQIQETETENAAV
jgi:hypothetical protein